MATEGLARPPLRVMFASLRVKLAVATLLLLATGALVTAWFVWGRLSGLSDAREHDELSSVGRTLADGIDFRDLQHPAALQLRLQRIRQANAELTAILVYRRAPGGGRRLVASTRRTVIGGWGLAERRDVRRRALGSYGLGPVERRDQARTLAGVPRSAGLSVPIRGPDRAPIGSVWVALDWAGDDAALTRDIRQMIVIAVVIALAVGLSLAALLSRAVFAPLRQLQAAFRAIREGSTVTRLAWRRTDELGELARDFDAMAADLQETHSRLRTLALKDPLTGLLNHRSFHEALQRELSDAGRTASSLALVALDLDHFKSVNDTYRHPYGDEVLRMVSGELRRAVRGEDLVARIGGEEFGVIVPGADAELGRRVAERARTAIAELEIRGGRPLSCSAGVAAFPEHAREGAVLLSLADGALYWAKRSGRDQTRVYDSDHVTGVAPQEERAEIQAVLSTPSLLRAVYQPWVELATGRLGGFEALSRFHGDGTRPPDEWFAQAQRCGLGDELEALAIRRALEARGRPGATFLSINMSPSALTSGAVHAVLPESLDRIVIEVTEQEAMVDMEGIERALGAFRSRGARIALDDAGVGYAGLQELMRLRPDIIKLDRSLIRSVPDDPSKVALVDSLVHFARRTGAVVCAEGIETLEELFVLADLDVTYGQGYLLARPGPPWPDPEARAVEELRRRSARGGLDPASAVGESTEAGDRRLENVCARISASQTADELAAVLSVVAEELDAEHACLSRWDPEQRTVETLVATPDCPDPGGGFYDLRDYPMTERVLRQGEAAQLLANDPAADEVEAGFLADSGYPALLMVPVASGGRTIGLLEVMRSDERAFTRSQTNRLRIVSHQLGGVLESGRLGRAGDGPSLRYRGAQRLAGV